MQTALSSARVAPLTSLGMRCLTALSPLAQAQSNPGAAPAPHPNTSKTLRKEPVTLNFVNAEIDAVARTLATLSGYNVVVDAPNGIGAPKGVDPAITARLRQAFRAAVASVEFKQSCDKIDAPVLYLDGPDYEKYVAQVYRKETMLIERLKLKELLKS